MFLFSIVCDGVCFSSFACVCVSSYASPRSTFTLHVEAGHTSVVEEGPKDLRCPFCLYHTKHKSNMIDHIVLHKGTRQPQPPHDTQHEIPNT